MKLTLLSGSRVRVELSGVWLNTALKENTTTSSKDVRDNLGTLGVTADDKLGVWASGVVRSDLVESVGDTLGNGCAVVGLDWVVEQDVLVVAAGETSADGVDELSLTSRVWLIVSLAQEDVDFGAC